MVRIAGVDVPDRKRAHVALRSIYGIGPKLAEEIVVKADLDPTMPPRMNELTEGAGQPHSRTGRPGGTYRKATCGAKSTRTSGG